MAILDFIILTAAEAAQAQTLDDDENAAINPRAVDGASPGLGVNLNDSASNYAVGAAVTLTRACVAPKRIVDDPAYQQRCPGLVTFLLTLPWASLETETIFAPPQE
jgi:hypothetical protein